MGRAWQCCVTQPRFCCCLLSPKHSLNHFSCVVSHCCQLLPLHGMLGVLFMLCVIFARVVVKVLNNWASTRMTMKDKRRGIRPRAVKNPWAMSMSGTQEQEVEEGQAQIMWAIKWVDIYNPFDCSHYLCLALLYFLLLSSWHWHCSWVFHSSGLLSS